MVPTHPDHTAGEIDAIINNITAAARVALGEAAAKDAIFRKAPALDTQKFDMQVDG